MTIVDKSIFIIIIVIKDQYIFIGKDMLGKSVPYET